MSDKELFETILTYFQDNYRLTIERPYQDTYIVIKDKSGNEIGDMNYGGYNLLANLSKLTKILEYELL